MIRLGLRLTLGSGREAALRVALTAAAVALGVGLLLSALAGMNGLHAQAERGAWLDTSPQSPVGATAGGSASLWWLLTTDQFGSQEIDRVDLAAAGRGAPVPPGMSVLPGPGQYDASPALARLLRTVPADELADRFPGRQVGVLGASALPSPNSLIIVIGHRPGQLARFPGAVQVQGIQRSLSGCFSCQSGVGSGPVLQWVLIGGALALLLPVLILIATAGRLSAARREERFAAMRLVGATPRQITVVAGVEMIVAALAGVLLGFCLFLVFRPLLYHVAFTGAPLATGDLSLGRADVLVVVLGVPLAAVVSSRLSLRRVQLAPMAVRAHAAPPPPRVLRIVPLLAGIGLLAYFDAAGKPGSNSGQLLELLVGFLLLIVGLVVAGPWFTTAGSRLMVARASRPSSLIAGRRLLDSPRSAFRFISGLVLALFITTAVVGALSSVEAATGATSASSGYSTLADLFCSFGTTNCPASEDVRSVPGRVVSMLRATPGVLGVTIVHEPPVFRQSGEFGVVACDQLVATPAIGRCARGATAASLGYFISNVLGHDAHAASTVWPSALLSPSEVARLPVDAVVVATDGSAGAVERARTALERAFPYQGTSRTVDALDPATARLLTMIEDMTEVVIAASLIIAACSLAVNIAAGLGDRKRPFSLLRLTGVPTSVLHRVVALESALPLFAVAAVAIVVGLASSALYLRSQVGIAFQMPGTAFWATVVVGLAGALAIIASTFPLLNRVTGPEVARNG